MKTLMMKASIMSDPFSLFRFKMEKGDNESINYFLFDSCTSDVFEVASSNNWANSMKLLFDPHFNNDEIDAILAGLNEDFKTIVKDSKDVKLLRYKNEFNRILQENKREEDPFLIESAGIATNSSYIGCIAKELELVDGPTDKKYCSNLKMKYPNTSFKANCIDCKRCIKEVMDILIDKLEEE